MRPNGTDREVGVDCQGGLIEAPAAAAALVCRKGKRLAHEQPHSRHRLVFFLAGADSSQPDDGSPWGGRGGGRSAGRGRSGSLARSDE